MPTSTATPLKGMEFDSHDQAYPFISLTELNPTLAANLDRTKPGWMKPFIDALVETQREEIPEYGPSLAALEEHEPQAVTVGNNTLWVQYNPSRKNRTNTRWTGWKEPDPEKASDCYLDAVNVSPHQLFIEFGDFAIGVNPYPATAMAPRHLNSVNLKHTPQLVIPWLEAMMRQAYAQGSSRFSLINPQEGGATAKKHSHIQSAEAATTPLEEEINRVRETDHATTVHRREGVDIFAYSCLGRVAVLLEAADPTAFHRASHNTARALANLAKPAKTPLGEPCATPIMRYTESGKWRQIYVPRIGETAIIELGGYTIKLRPAGMEIVGYNVTETEEGLTVLTSPDTAPKALQSMYEQVCHIDRDKVVATLRAT
ncbi:hypothetical protein JNM87_01565 [Candidatus Saccharibacteria bacterium]|nr:hypothetical protein [Candidatus Saccharibacteria bacterium]